MMINRRNFISSVIAAPAFIEQKPINTLPRQIDIIQNLYKLSKEMKYDIFVNVPYYHEIDEFNHLWTNCISIPIISIFDNTIILVSIPEIGNISEQFSWIVGNNIMLNNPEIPEKINFDGTIIPFCEIIGVMPPKPRRVF